MTPLNPGAIHGTSAVCREIVVIEDDPFILDRIVEIITDANFAETISAFDHGADGLAHVAKHDCDIVLVDLGLPDLNGVEVIEALKRTGCKADIMVITTTQNPQKIIQSIQAGASGYFLKGNLQTDLLPYLTALKAGGAPIDPVIARKLLEMLRTPAPATPAPNTKPLSEQETRILTYVAKGFISREIAELLGLSPLTVSTHIRNIYKKLAVKSRTEAVFEASNQGLIPAFKSNSIDLVPPLDQTRTD